MDLYVTLNKDFYPQIKAEWDKAVSQFQPDEVFEDVLDRTSRYSLRSGKAEADSNGDYTVLVARFKSALTCCDFYSSLVNESKNPYTGSNLMLLNRD